MAMRADRCAIQGWRHPRVTKQGPIGRGLPAIVFLIGMAQEPSLQAQPNPDSDAPVLAWVSVGIGSGSGGFAAAADVNVLIRRHLLSIRATSVTSLFEDGYWDYAVLYGQAHRTSHGLMALSAGISVVDGQHDCGLFVACQPLHARIGLPLAARLDWKPLSFVGAGLYGFANINSLKSISGIVVSAQVGRLAGQSPFSEAASARGITTPGGRVW
jgi:hypothetical protein